MDKMRMETADLTARNVEKIAALFPNCVTEALDEERSTKECKVYKKVVNFELLRQMLSDEVIEGDEAYEFTWVGKKAAVVEAHKPIRKTLRPYPEESVNWDTTENLYIEGDNLEVLKLLQESYLGKVKMIYIDPPYNTGHDFVYPDSFIMDNEEYNAGTGYFDEDGNVNFSRENSTAAGKYHSDWCSMMYSRLLLARDLLTDDGVIFISIDDNEQGNLKKICDEIFGSDNFVTQIIIQSNKRGHTYKQIAKTHEYLLIYTKNDTELNELEKNENNDDLNFQDSIGKFNIRELRNRNPKFGKFNRPNLFYPIFVNPHSKDKDGFCPISIHSSKDYTIKVEPLNSVGQESCWRWSNAKVSLNAKDNTLESNLVAKQKMDGGYNIYEKYRKATYKAKTIWDEVSMITEKGTVELGELKLSTYFDFPKPIQLIANAIKIGTPNDSIVLDFFSGSSTTAHAVMQLNAEDNGNRKFIMVQLPEPTDKKSEAYKAGYKNICEIGKERIRRAGKKILEENADKEGIDKLDVGFRVLKLDDSNMNDVYYAAGDYTQDLLRNMESNIKDDRTDLDLLFGCLLEWGLPLSLPYTSETIEGATVHTYNDGDLVACFDENISDAAIKSIAKKKPLRAVFRDSSFADSPAKINVGEIFKMLSPDTRVKVI